jgi:hypothetical protein
MPPPGGNYEGVVSMDLGLSGRFAIIPGLELSFLLPMPLSLYEGEESVDGYAGLLVQPRVGLRLWYMDAGVGILMSTVLPIDTRDEDEGFLAPPFTLITGLQYSTMNLIDAFRFDAQFTLIIPFTKEYDFWWGKEEISQGMNLDILVEARYSFGVVTPYLGCDFTAGLTKSKYVLRDRYGNKEEIEVAPAKLGGVAIFGLDFEFSESVSAGLYYHLGLVGEYYAHDEKKGTETSMTLGFHFTVGF